MLQPKGLFSRIIPIRSVSSSFNVGLELYFRELKMDIFSIHAIYFM